MKKIGLIGGLSWVSTADYYRLLNELTQKRLGGVNSAQLILESVNRQKYVEAVIDREDEEAACQIILEAARSIEQGGAEFIVISCNDVHRFVPDIEPHLDIPFLHIAEATAQAIKAKNINSVGLLGVRKTMEEPFYPEILKANGIETIIPNEDEKTYIHDSIYEELVKDLFLDTTRERYAGIIGDLQTRGAEAVVLGCTEMPLLLGDDDVDIPTFSTSSIHCHAAVDMALSE
jgi:aspartate racemase